MRTTRKLLVKKLVYCYLGILFLLNSFSVKAIEINQEYSTPDFEAASKAESQLKFQIKSTKFGLMTSTVDGYAKKFQIEGRYDSKVQGGIFSKVKVTIPVSSMDTDNGSRDEKMQDYCLDFKNNPALVIEFPAELTEGSSEREYQAQLTVRNKKFTVPVTLQLNPNEKYFDVVLKSRLSFKQLEIPDPSIAIASVDDTIEISGKIQILTRKE